MKHIKLFEAFVASQELNEATAEFKLGRITPANKEEKAEAVLAELRKAIGETISGEDLKKISGRNWGSSKNKFLKNAKVEIIDAFYNLNYMGSLLQWTVVLKTDHDMHDTFGFGGGKLEDMEGWDSDRQSRFYVKTPEKTWQSDDQFMMTSFSFTASSSDKEAQRFLTILGLDDVIL